MVAPAEFVQCSASGAHSQSLGGSSQQPPPSGPSAFLPPFRIAPTGFELAPSWVYLLPQRHLDSSRSPLGRGNQDERSWPWAAHMGSESHFVASATPFFPSPFVTYGTALQTDETPGPLAVPRPYRNIDKFPSDCLFSTQLVPECNCGCPLCVVVAEALRRRFWGTRCRSLRIAPVTPLCLLLMNPCHPIRPPRCPLGNGPVPPLADRLRPTPFRLTPTTAHGYRGFLLVAKYLGSVNRHITLAGGLCVRSMDAG